MGKQYLIQKLDDIYMDIITHYSKDNNVNKDIKDVLIKIDELQQQIDYKL